jgi:hypothetical protein
MYLGAASAERKRLKLDVTSWKNRHLQLQASNLRLPSQRVVLYGGAQYPKSKSSILIKSPAKPIFLL